MREHYKLTVPGVKRIRKPGWHGDGGNLYLAVSETGAKSWLFIWKKRGKLHRMGLGSASTVSLTDARAKALEARKLLDHGRDPLAERNIADAESLTFGEAADRYISENEAGWRSAKHRKEWRRSLETHAKPLWLMAVSEIATDHVRDVLMSPVRTAGKATPLWSAKTVTAMRLRGRIENVLDWSRQNRHRTKENAARLELLALPALPAKRQRVKHHPAMDFHKVPDFMAKLRDMDSIQARALEFTILTSARTGESLGATWNEINLDDRLWTIPAQRMKAHAQHVVPLSDRAVTILRGMAKRRINDLVFPGFREGKQLSGMSLLRVLELADVSEVTVHGFRSSFRDWAGDRTAFPREVAEAALAHFVGDDTERAYRRGAALDKRRKLMAMWALHCSRPETGNVVQLRRRRAR